MSRPYFPPSQRAQKILDSPDVQQKLNAGTHRVELRSKYLDLQLIDGKAVGVPLTDPATGKETVKEFRLWKIPKNERPKCGARCRNGALCQARVAVRPDGSFHTRCRMHGAASPFVRNEAAVKARIARLEATREELEKGRERDNAPEVAALITATLAEIEETLAMLKTGPEKPTRLPRRRKPKPPSQTLSEKEMGDLLLKLGVFSNIE